MQYDKNSKALWAEYISMLATIAIVGVVIIVTTTMSPSEELVVKLVPEYSIEVTRKIVALKESLEVDMVCYDKSNELWLVKNSSSGLWHFEFDINLKFATLENDTDIFISPMRRVFREITNPNIKGLFCI